jgi:hypothetical protein
MFNLSPNFMRYLGDEVKVVGLWGLFTQVNDLVERMGKRCRLHHCNLLFLHCFNSLGGKFKNTETF